MAIGGCFVNYFRSPTTTNRATSTANNTSVPPKRSTVKNSYASINNCDPDHFPQQAILHLRQIGIQRDNQTRIVENDTHQSTSAPTSSSKQSENK